MEKRESLIKRLAWRNFRGQGNKPHEPEKLTGRSGSPRKFSFTCSASVFPPSWLLYLHAFPGKYWQILRVKNQNSLKKVTYWLVNVSNDIFGLEIYDASRKQRKRVQRISRLARYNPSFCRSFYKKEAESTEFVLESWFSPNIGEFDQRLLSSKD